MVYHSDTEKVQKHRLVKFVNKVNVEKQTQTFGLDPNDDNNSVRQPRASRVTHEVNEITENAQETSAQSDSPVTMPDDSSQTQPSVTNDESESGWYPNRDRRKPSH